MPRNTSIITRTGVSAAALGAEVTLVAAYVVPALNTLRVTDVVFACNVTGTFWLATAGFVHQEQFYQPAGGGGYGSVTLGTPLEIAAGATVLVRAIAAGSAYTECTWIGLLLS
jgi:hypothetical protein